MTLSDTQRLAICAQLNLVLGAAIYDRLFLGADFDELKEGILYVFARDAECSNEIEDFYALDIATIAENVLKTRVDFIYVHPDEAIGVVP